MSPKEVVGKTQEYTDWNALLKKKFRHDPEMSKLNLRGFLQKYEAFIYKRAIGYENYAKNIGSFLDKDDIASFGREGILNALRKYDPKRNVKFLSFADWDIKQYMQRGIEEATHLRPGSFENIRKVRKALKLFEIKGVENPTKEQLYKATKLSPDVVAKTLEEMSVYVNSIDAPLSSSQQGGGDEARLEDMIAKKEMSGIEMVMHFDYQEGQVAKAIKAAGLDERESNILVGHVMYGKNHSEIGREMNLSGARISQQMEKIAVKIRASRFFSEELSRRAIRPSEN